MELDTLFRRVVVLRLQKDRAKESRRSREHAAQRLTWLSSQQSQSEEPSPSFGFHRDEKTEEDEMEETTIELVKLVKPLSREEIQTLVEAKCMNDDFVVFLRAIFDVSTPKTNDGVARAVWTFDSLLTRMGSGLEVGRLDDVVAELLSRTNFLADGVVAFLAERALACVLSPSSTPKGTSAATESGATITSSSEVQPSKPQPQQQSGRASRQALAAILEILCKLVFRLHGFPRGTLDPDLRCREDLSAMDGEGFHIHIIEAICRAHWSSEAVIPLLSAVRELCSKSTQAKLSEALKILGIKVVKALGQVPEKDLPEAYSQVLAISTMFYDRMSTIEALVKYFEEMQVGFIAPPVLGQVLSRLIIAASQDAQIGSCMMKSLENQRSQWSVTAMCFLLALGKVKRFEKTVIDAFRKRAVTSAELYVRIKTSPWLSHMESSANTLLCTKAFYDSFCGVCESAHQGGWDLIVPILVKCAVTLADEHNSFALNRNPHFDVELEENDENEEGQSNQHNHILPPNVVVGCIGVRVLAKCFSQFVLSRSDLLTEVINRALISAADGKGALSFIRFFYRVSRGSLMTNRTVFADHSVIIKDLIALLPSVSPRVAHGLLRGLEPGLDPRSPFRDVRDHAMVVFRKGLFQRDSNPRFVSLLGLVTCCRTTWTGITQTIEEAQRDAIGCLRRCLSQQYDLRFALYAALKHFPSSFRHDLLVGHLVSTVVEPSGDTDLPPLRFDAVIDSNVTGKSKEPIAALLRTVCSDASVWDMTSVVSRMAQATVPVFSLDKNSSFDVSTIQGCVNRSVGTMVIESCEVLMDALMSSRVEVSSTPSAGTPIASSSSRPSTSSSSSATRIADSRRSIATTTPKTPAAAVAAPVFVDFDSNAEWLGKVASLWRVQRAVRRLIQLSLNKDQEQQQQQTVSENAKKKLKHKSEEKDEEMDDEGEGGGGGAKKEDAIRSSSSKKDTDERLRLPGEGEWLSEASLVAMIQLACERCTLTAMMEALSPSTTASGNNKREDMASVLSNIGFHSYLMSAIKSRLLVLQRSTPSASSSSTTATTMHLNAEMAESCAGYAVLSPVQFLLAIARSITKLLKRYASLESQLERKTALAKGEATAASGEENELGMKNSSGNKKQLNKKRKASASSGNTDEDASPVAGKSIAELITVRDLATEVLRDTLALAASVSPRALVQVTREAFGLSAAEFESGSQVLSSASNRIYEMLLDCLVERRLNAASYALEMISKLLIGVPSTSPSAVVSFEEHLHLMKQLLVNDYCYPLVKKERQGATTMTTKRVRKQQVTMITPATVVKQIVKLYLELSMRVDRTRFTLGPAFNEIAEALADAFSTKSKDDDEDDDDEDNEGGAKTRKTSAMFRGKTNAQSGVLTLVQMISSPVLEECERAMTTIPQVFSSQEKQTALVQRLEAAGGVLVVLMSSSQLPRGPVTELVLRTLTRLYKCCIKLFKGLAQRKLAVAPDALEKLIRFMWKNLTPMVDERLKAMENASSSSFGTGDHHHPDSSSKKQKKRTSKSSASTSSKDVKLIPDVVFHVEQYEAVLLKASKACVEIQGLTRYVRRLTARDFRVDKDRIAMALSKEDEDNGENDEDREE